MSDYYFIKNDQSPLGYDPVLLEDWVKAVERIAWRKGVKITQSMILAELGFGKKKQPRRKKRIHLYIDGTNLFAGQYDLFGPKRVLSFRSVVAQIKKQLPVTKVFFYASYTPRTFKRRPDAFFSCEAYFYREAMSIPGLVFYKGHRSPTSGKEKGVDVHLAVDMIRDAFMHRFEEAVIMTGDADLIYPVELTQSLKYPVHAVFLPNRFSLELAYKTQDAIVLNYEEKFRSERKLPKHLRIVPIKSPICKQMG